MRAVLLLLRPLADRHAPFSSNVALEKPREASLPGASLSMDLAGCTSARSADP